MKNNFIDIKSFNFYYGVPIFIVKDSLEKKGYTVFEGNNFLVIRGRFKEELKTSIKTYTSVKFEIEKDSVSVIRGV